MTHTHTHTHTHADPNCNSRLAVRTHKNLPPSLPPPPPLFCCRVISALRSTSVPSSLPCRDAEKREIKGLLAGCISRGAGGAALYISGMPGTGKTATVTECIRWLKQESAGGRLPPFSYLEINAMKLSSPYALYTLLWRVRYVSKERGKHNLFGSLAAHTHTHTHTHTRIQQQQQTLP